MSLVERRQIGEAEHPLRKVVVTGFSGSGKSTLCLLLDGHPDLRVSFLSEEFERIFSRALRKILAADRFSSSRGMGRHPYFNLDLSHQVVRVSFPTFARLLYSETYYPAIEAEAFSGLTVSGHADNKLQSLLFNFDFAKFQSSWKQELFSGEPKLTPVQVVEILHRALFNACRRLPAIIDDRPILVFCSSEQGGSLEWPLWPDETTRYIILKRSLEDLWAVAIERSIGTGIDRRTAENRLVRSGRMANQSARVRQYEEIAKKFPTRALLLDIEQVVVGYREIMPTIARFIGIEDLPCLYTPTFHGESNSHLADYFGSVSGRGRASLISPGNRSILRAQSRGAGVVDAMFQEGIAAATSVAALRLRRWRPWRGSTRTDGRP